MTVEGALEDGGAHRLPLSCVPPMCWVARHDYRLFEADIPGIHGHHPGENIENPGSSTSTSWVVEVWNAICDRKGHPHPRHHGARGGTGSFTPGTAIDVYPAWNIDVEMRVIIVDSTKKAAVSLTRGLPGSDPVLTGGKALCHRGEPPRLLQHCPLHQQGHRCSHGGLAPPLYAGRGAGLHGLRHRPVQKIALCGGVSPVRSSFEKLLDWHLSSARR